ncbi:MAG: hypothetical protein QOE05_2157 [Actinomycetota bacterium]|jgi:hypothetical protein|nr:hypothetical protein [Actinomycetota bacterium]
MRRTAALLALAVPAALALTAAPAPAATPGPPAYKTTLLVGSAGNTEPRVTVAPDGARYLTTNEKGTGNEIVFRSATGTTWNRVTMPPDQTSATIDVDVVAMHTGRILTSELDTAGINFITHYSDDQGKTWTQSTGQTFADTDRQWFAVGPDDPSTHQPTVYLLFHNLLSGLLQHNMFVQTSHDGGATFGVPIPVATPGQQDYLDLQCGDSGGPSSISVNQKTGQVYVVFGTRSSPVGGCAAQPVEVNIVAANRVWVVTAAAGKTETPGAWTPSLAVDNTASGKITGMQLAPGALDDAGNVYVAYPESVNPYPDYNGAAIKVVHAAADLKSWSKPITVAPAGGAGNVLPHIVAGDAGKIALSWWAGDSSKIWHAMAGQVLDALSASPHVTSVQLSDAIAEKGTASELMGACNEGPTATLNGFACGRSADVYGIAADTCGRTVLAWPAIDGTYASQQVSGTTLRSGVCGQAAVPPTVVKPIGQPPAAPPPGSGGGLPTTGAPAGVAAIAAFLLLTAAVLRRRLRT